MTTLLRLAGCVLTNGQGHILLLHRHTPKRTHWEIPGGKIDPGESESDTVIREIKEELVTTVTLTKRLGAKEFHEDNFTMHYAWYLGKVTGPAPSIGEPDTFDDMRYFSLSELQAIRDELSGNTANFLDAWQAGEFTLTSN